jgi:hypothetical protein
MVSGSEVAYWEREAGKEREREDTLRFHCFIKSCPLFFKKPWNRTEAPINRKSIIVIIIPIIR